MHSQIAKKDHRNVFLKKKLLKTHLNFTIDWNSKHILSIFQDELFLPRKDIEAQPKKLYAYIKKHVSQLANKALNLSTMVGEYFLIYTSQLTKNALKWSTMVRENFGIYSLNWPKIYINFPPWLDKILEFTHRN